MVIAQTKILANPLPIHWAEVFRNQERDSLKLQLDVDPDWIDRLDNFIEIHIAPKRETDIRFEHACQAIVKVKKGEPLDWMESIAFTSAEQMMVLAIGMNDKKRDFFKI